MKTKIASIEKGPQAEAGGCKTNRRTRATMVLGKRFILEPPSREEISRTTSNSWHVSLHYLIVATIRVRVCETQSTAKLLGSAGTGHRFVIAAQYEYSGVPILTKR